MTLRQRTRRCMGMLARKSLAKQRSNERHAREQRDACIRQIHSLSYCRTRKDGSRFFVPRKKELRGKLRVAIGQAQAWAWLARPYYGYPKPPRYDNEFPRVRRQKTKHAQVSAEIRSLEFWHGVLEARGESLDVLERVDSYLITARRRLNRLLGDGQSCIKKCGRTYEKRNGPFGLQSPTTAAHAVFA